MAEFIAYLDIEKKSSIYGPHREGKQYISYVLFSLSVRRPHAHEIHTWKWGIMAGLKTPLKINKILYYRKSWTENVLGVLKRFLCLQNKILAYMFGPRDDFQTFGWAKKLTLHSPPSSLKIISRTKHVCRDFVLWRKRFRTTSDVLRPRFPVVIYYL